jgi:hypothetical protein
MNEPRWGLPDPFETALTSGRLLRSMTIAVTVVLGACGSQASLPGPVAVPTIPAGWVTVSTAGAEIQLTLPPWLVVFDNVNAIFANEAPREGESEIPIQLMAIPPGVDSDPGPGDDLVAWLDTRLNDPGKGVPVVTEINLPAGRAVRYERLDRAGTPTARHILAFAVRTRAGPVYLLIDGLPDAWPGHAEDIERIPLLLRVR